MLNKKRKSVRLRGHHTHGYGSKKKHRGSGHRGGVGMAGTGKRADQKKPRIWKDKKYFGRHGFTSVGKTDFKPLTLFYIDDHFDALLKSGKIKPENDLYILDLKDLKRNKLLGSGKVSRKYKIVCDYASGSALSKVEAAGGVVELRNKLKIPEKDRTAKPE